MPLTKSIYFHSMTTIVLFGFSVATITTFNGCGKRRNQVYESAEKIMHKCYSREQLVSNNSMMEWSLHDTFGATGPYSQSDDMPIQSNAGRSVVFCIVNRSKKTCKKYIPKADDEFFIGIPVKNSGGKNAMIVCKATKKKGQEN